MKIFVSTKGGAAVEFALILPVLILILFGIVEFSLIMYDKAVITNASREGARQGIIYRADGGVYSPLTVAEIQTAVMNYLNSSHLYCLRTPLDPIVEPLPDTPSLRMLTVRVTYRYNFLIIPNIPGVNMVDHVDLTSETVIRMESDGT
jgi:TadE-like protein